MNQVCAGVPSFPAAGHAWRVMPLLLAWSCLQAGDATPGGDFATRIRPLLAGHCLECHGATPKKNELDLARFASEAQARARPRVWVDVIEQLEAREMPPPKAKTAKALTDEERARLIAWARALVDAEALARSGDPGPVKLRRLGNVEYDRTIRELTGVDLGLARQFPAEGSAGEGFANTGEGASMSPVLFAKYADAARKAARHLVLLPDGFRFSISDQARDWTVEALPAVRAFHERYADAKGELVVEPYIAATLRHRARLAGGASALADVAREEKLQPRYLATLWQELNDSAPSPLLDELRALWRKAGPDGAKPVAAFIDGLRAKLWKYCPSGDFKGVGHFSPWQTPASTVARRRTISVGVKAGKQGEVTLHLGAIAVGAVDPRAVVRWEKPRIEGGGAAPMLLADIPEAVKSLSNAVAFGRHPQGKPLDRASLAGAAGSAITLSFPYAAGVPAGAKPPGSRTIVVEAVLDEGAASTTQVLPAVGTAAAKALTVASADLAAVLGDEGMNSGADAFRALFPRSLVYAPIIPNDTIVTLKLLHREDEHLLRLMLDERERAEIDRLWRELEYISRDAESLGKSFEVWYGFTTQEAAGENGAGATFARKLRGPIRERAERFAKELLASEAKHLDALAAFAERAWRRPLESAEREEILGLYRRLRGRAIRHEEAMRISVTRVLSSPSFIYRIEAPGPGDKPTPIDGWALASRLSYFLWAGPPDDELRALAASGKLRDDATLAAQAKRMIADPRLRGLASEFGGPWLHVRGFDQRSDKSETLFPQYDAALRAALYEETLRFVEDLFRRDQPLARAIDADWIFANEAVAKHYGIALKSPGWQKVEAAGAFGRGGVLGLATVLAAQSGASRTSPILRGNWVVEHMLGDKLPKPPDMVPQLPETEPAGLSMRELITRHSSAAECAICHRRIDPCGFALEGYDAIGRRRAGDKDGSGRTIDLAVALDDGTRFTGPEGLRRYLLGPARERFMRTFSRKLLGYALGRAVEISDRPLIESLTARLAKGEIGVAQAAVVIVQSQQFRTIRGRDVVASSH